MLPWQEHRTESSTSSPSASEQPRCEQRSAMAWIHAPSRTSSTPTPSASARLSSPSWSSARLQHRRPVLRDALEGGLVDADALAEGEVAAEPGGERGDAVTDGGERDSARPVAAPARRPRECVQQERGRVPQGMDGADPPVAAAHVGPVGGAGQGGRDRGQDADPDQPLGRLVGLSPPTRSRASALVQAPITTSVSGGWTGCPSHVPLSTSLTTDPVERPANRVLQRLGDGVEGVDLLDLLGDQLACQQLGSPGHRSSSCSLCGGATRRARS